MAFPPLVEPVAELPDAERTRTARHRVLAGFGGAWRAALALRAIPRILRDPAYRWLARNRYRWFGRSEACWLPEPEHAPRFLH